MPARKKTVTMRVQQIKSLIGNDRGQREVVRGLGLRRMHHVVEVPDNPSTRGMVAKVPHLVRVLDDDRAKTKEKKS